MALKVRCRNTHLGGRTLLYEGASRQLDPVYRVVAHGETQRVNNKRTDRLCSECAKATCLAYLGWGWAFTCEVIEECRAKP